MDTYPLSEAHTIVVSVYFPIREGGCIRDVPVTEATRPLLSILREGENGVLIATASTTEALYAAALPRRPGGTGPPAVATLPHDSLTLQELSEIHDILAVAAVYAHREIMPYLQRPEAARRLDHLLHRTHALSGVPLPDDDAWEK